MEPRSSASASASSSGPSSGASASSGSQPPTPADRLAPAARRTAEALVRAALPPGRRYAPAGPEVVDRAEALLAKYGGRAIPGYAVLLTALEHAPRLSHRGRGFSSLSPDEAGRFLSAWAGGSVAQRALALGAAVPLKVAYYDDPAIYRELGATFRYQAKAEPARWMSQVTRGEELTEDVELEADAVVVGTGAGGAVVAKELAERGLAVVMLEEGGYHRRDEFDGGGIDGLLRFYRERGLTGTVGNAVVSLPIGKLVGGSTAVNTGTCWRTPAWILEKWVREEGLGELTEDLLAPYFERVERELQAEVADARYLGGVARVIARGCDVLGYSHRPLKRNAPACDGSGVCDFGCPTDARRSMNVSYVPAALQRGAALYTGVCAERLLLEGGKARGVVAKTAAGHQLRIRAAATVLSCGTTLTPGLLQRHRLHETLPHIGRHLTIHPAATVSALFDEPIRGYAAIPQGYCVDELHRDGILFLGASVPIDLAAAQFFFVGEKLVELMDSYDRIASFGAMVADEAHGRVISRDGKPPRLLYRVGERERARLQRGTETLCRIFLAAGAREVYPALHGHRIVRDAHDLRRLREARPAASDFLLTAFHPLGTCRMALTPRRGVVSPDHEVFGVEGLYVVDGSVVPTSPAVNPQVTIMALATRAAERIGRRLEG